MIIQFPQGTEVDNVAGVSAAIRSCSGLSESQKWGGLRGLMVHMTAVNHNEREGSGVLVLGNLKTHKSSCLSAAINSLVLVMSG